MGRVGSCFDNAAAESFFSTLEHEVLSRHHFTTRAEARAVDRRLVPRVLQHPTTAQLRGVAATDRVREDRRRPTGRGIRNPPRFEGKLTPAISWTGAHHTTRGTTSHQRSRLLTTSGRTVCRKTSKARCEEC